MAPERVIQDSDDEDDALSDVATSIDPLQEHEHEQHEEDYANAQTDHGDEPYEQEMRTADPVVTGSQLGVNFDDFLQSQPQMAGEHGPSSSQVKREERWIPAESGNESVGAMMSEIGHAQRLLVDDVTPLDYPQLPSTDQSADPLLCTYQSSSDGAIGVKRPQSTVDPVDGEDQDAGSWSEHQAKRSKVSEDENGEDEIVNLPQNGNEHELQELLQHSAATDEHSHSGPGADDPVDKASTNDNEASITNSYNYFDSSLKLREYTEVSTLPIASSADELVETARRTPGRSKSMQVLLDSPHDTEPFSSLASLHAKRAKSDIPVKPISPKPSMDTPDELSLPVTVEVPAQQKKKRGRKKKQPVEDDIDGEPDELNADATHGMHEEPKKRGRGRPRKVPVEDMHSPKPHFDELDAEEEVNADTAQPSEIADSRSMQNGRTEVAFYPVQADAGLPHEQYIPRPSRSRAQPIENYESPDSISEMPKETKKRKIKRGKTTSIIMKKSYESDVEDDVIWIDEKPANGPSKAGETTPAAHNCETLVDDLVEGVDRDSKDIKPVDMTEDATKREINQAQPSEPPGPKKRGRKRKKTMEPVIAEPPIEEQIPEDTKSNEQHTALEDTTNNAVPLTATDEGQSITNDNIIQEMPETRNLTPELNISTPKKPAAEPQKENTTACTPQNKTKGPDKHSPITSTSKIPFRVGLSRRARIAPLLKVVRK
ncbi:Vacuolar protein sorting-associated protein 11 [Paecilomyces lecythidis]|uniref:Vacuolar protein sorting-associated protein 11 n=1 Tax=Paecilomyces lecythidis TaxID=3004212 RepID=A0ABR3YA45_9EURO